MNRLLSSSSELVVILRLLLLLANLRALGSIWFARSSLSHASRILFGLGGAFLAVFVGTILQGGAPGTITLILLCAMLAAGWIVSAWRLRRWLPELRARGFRVLADVLPFLLLFVVAVTVVHADWPRWVPITSDPQQHAFFTRKVIDYGGIPRALLEMGGDAFNYPAGTGVLGYIVHVLCGLLPAEVVSLLNGIFLLIFSLMLVEAAHAARLPLVQRCLLAIVAFMVGIGGFGAWEGFPGNGKNISFWLVQIWLAQLLLMRRSGGDALVTLVQLALLLVPAAELNPTLAMVWAWVALLTLIVLRGEGGLSLRRLGLAAGVGALAGTLMIAADPFFHALASGEKISAASIEHLSQGRIHLQAAGESFFLVKLAQHLLTLVQKGPRKAVVFFVLMVLILLGNLRTLRRLSPKTALIGLGVALLPSLLLVAIATYLAIPPGSAAMLLVPYNVEVLTLTFWMAAFVLAVWSLNSAAGLLPSRWPQRAGVAVSTLAFAVAIVLFGLRPHYERHGSPNLRHLPPAPEKVPAGLNEVLGEVADLWRRDRGAKVLLVNWEFLGLPPERWIMPEYYSSSVALLAHANPAFFFFRGSPDYTYDNYYSKVCLTWDPDWLRERGIRWVLLPPKGTIQHRCNVLRQVADAGRYGLREVASIPSSVPNAGHP